MSKNTFSTEHLRETACDIKTSFIRCFIVTPENLIWPVVFYFSVHGDQQRNKIYVQRCIYKKKNSQKNTSELQDPFLVKECFDNTTEKIFFRKIWE